MKDPERKGPEFIKSSNRVIVALAFAAFALGSTEFVVVGLLTDIAKSLGVTVNTAGLLIGVYALTVVFATPLVAAATAHVSPRKVILVIISTFSVANFVAGCAPNYGILLASRIFMAIAHGSFFGVALTVATSLAGQSKAGRANATIMTGVTVAMVIGVPAGTWLGQSLGWQAPFLVIGVFGIACLTMLAFVLPHAAEPVARVSMAKQFSSLFSWGFARLYLVTVLAIASTLVFFTFLSPYLKEVAGVNGSQVGVALLIFGAATVFGNYLGGRLTDRVGWKTVMSYELIGLILSLFAAFLMAQNSTVLLGAIGLVGFFGFAMPSIMQTGIIETAKFKAPQSGIVASGLTVAAINLGIAAGSTIGGIMLPTLGVVSTPWVGALLGASALVLLRFDYTITRTP